MRRYPPPILLICSVVSVFAHEAQAACPGAYAGKSCGPSGTNICQVSGGGASVVCKLEVVGGLSQAGTLNARSPALYQFEAWGEDDEGQTFCCELSVAASDVQYEVQGTPQDDDISMNDQSGVSLKYGRAYVYGYGGNDTILGSHDASCVDVLDGGDGADIIHGLAYRDTIFGQAGADILYGGPDQDTIWGGPEGDEIYGGDGDDLLYGDEAGDLIKGGDGNDSMYGGIDDDIMCGNFGADILQAGGGNDIVFGGSGVDTNEGGTGASDQCENENQSGCEINIFACP